LRVAAISLGLAETVENYELRFDVWSSGNNCAAANIAGGGDSTVIGVLYEIAKRRLPL
jgi:hypothetical protein